MEEKSQNTMQEPSKVNGTKVAGIVAIIISIISLGMSIFVLYDSNYKKENIPSEKEENKEQEKPNTEEETPKDPETPEEQENPNTGEEIPKEPEIPKGEPISNELSEKLYLMMRTMDCGHTLYEIYDKEKVTAEELPNTLKNELVVKSLDPEKDNAIFRNDWYYYTEEAITNAKNRVLGEETSYHIIEGRGCLEFQKQEDGTYFVQIFCGEVCMFDEEYYFENAVKAGDIIYIDQVMSFVDTDNCHAGNDTPDECEVKYYKDFAQKEFLGKTLLRNPKYQEKEYLEKKKEVFLANYKDKADIHRFTFKDNGDGTYQFIQMERIKR